MSEISFAKDEAKHPSIAVESTVVSTSAPVPVPVPAIGTIGVNGHDGAVGAPGVQEAPAGPRSPDFQPAASEPNRSLQPTGFMLGDRLPTFADVIMPRINIVQGLGDLKDSFTQGGIVFNQQFEIYTPQTNRKVAGVDTLVPGTAPLRIVCLGLKPDRYVEKTAGGRGMLVNTEAEVRAAGGTLDYSEWQLKKAHGMKRFGPMAEALILIEKPADAAGVAPTPLDSEPVFIYEVEGKRYTMAFWSMTWTSYTEGAKKAFLTNRRTGCLRAGYPTFMFTLATRLKPFDNGNETWVPVCLPLHKTPDALLKFAKDVLTAS